MYACPALPCSCLPACPALPLLQVLASLLPPKSPEVFRKLFPLTKLSCEINAWISMMGFSWLVGEMELREADIVVRHGGREKGARLVRNMELRDAAHCSLLLPPGFLALLLPPGFWEGRREKRGGRKGGEAGREGRREGRAGEGRAGKKGGLARREEWWAP